MQILSRPFQSLDLVAFTNQLMVILKTVSYLACCGSHPGAIKQSPMFARIPMSRSSFQSSACAYTRMRANSPSGRVRDRARARARDVDRLGLGLGLELGLGSGLPLLFSHSWLCVSGNAKSNYAFPETHTQE